jgi:hypothetical protein
LTFRAEEAQNRYMLAARRAVVASVLISALLSTASLGVCAGWESSARARMACCAGAEHDGTRAEADDCCAAGEQRQHGEMFGVALHALPPPQTAAIAFFEIPPFGAPGAAGLSRVHRPLGSPSDIHVLLSVFLI